MRKLLSSPENPQQVKHFGVFISDHWTLVHAAHVPPKTLLTSIILYIIYMYMRHNTNRTIFLSVSIINCQLQVFPTFATNRFTNTNTRVYYNTVWGQPLQLLDSQIGPTCLNTIIK